MGLLASASVANAAFVPFVTDDVVTGDEMVALKVTVEFLGGASESQMWEVISTTPLNTGDPIIDQNGFSGGAIADTWSMVQSGPTLGGFNDQGIAYGLWTLKNEGDTPIVGFSLDGLTGPGINVAFDITPGPTEGTPDSSGGMEFVSASGTSHTYTDLVNPMYSDLYWGLSVTIDNHLTRQQTLIFFADTDLVNASAPAALGLVFGGLLFARRFKK